MLDARVVHIAWEGLDGGFTYPVDVPYGEGIARTCLLKQQFWTTGHPVFSASIIAVL